MKAVKFAAMFEQVVNQVREEHGITEKVKIIPCEVVQICANGRHKDVETGHFTND